jgi:hypothetical protein
MTGAKVYLHKNGDSPHRLSGFRLLYTMFVTALFMGFSNLVGTVPIFDHNFANASLINALASSRFSYEFA